MRVREWWFGEGRIWDECRCEPTKDCGLFRSGELCYAERVSFSKWVWFRSIFDTILIVGDSTLQDRNRGVLIRDHYELPLQEREEHNGQYPLFVHETVPSSNPSSSISTIRNRSPFGISSKRTTLRRWGETWKRSFTSFASSTAVFPTMCLTPSQSTARCWCWCLPSLSFAGAQ